MATRFFELIGITALVFGIFFAVMAVISYNKHDAMKKKGKPVQATVVRIYQSATRTGSGPSAPGSHAYIALVRFTGPFSASEKRMEYGFPETRPDAAAGTQFSMLYNPEGEILIMKEHLREPFEAMKTPVTFGGFFFLAGAVLPAIRWKAFS